MEDSFIRPVNDVISVLGSNEDVGLTDAHIEVQRRRYGSNEMPAEEKTPLWKMILEQFEDRMVQILLFAAAISLVLTFLEGNQSDFTSYIEPLVIMLILIANATVGVIQESNAEKAIEALKAYEPEVATVLRNGKLGRIAAQELVPGDIIEVAVGNKIPADCRVVQLLSTALRVDQALLTGETKSVNKDIAPIKDSHALVQDKVNMIFSGSTVAYGKARAVVVCTGAKTEIGRIRQSIQDADDTVSPMKKKLDEFGEFLSRVILVICIAVWLINVHHFTDPAHGGLIRGAIYYFKIAVALAVAAIPEGLPAVVTTCLALGTKRMAKKNAIVRSLPSVETLGCTTVICSDKTGTLTTNQMSVKKILTVRGIGAISSFDEYDVDGTTYAPIGVIRDSKGSTTVSNEPVGLNCIMKVSALCNDSNIHYNSERRTYEVMGESTEAALRTLVEKYGNSTGTVPTGLSADVRVDYCNKRHESQNVPFIHREFSRDRKSMSVIVGESLPKSATTPGRPSTRSQTRAELDESRTLMVKGAPEMILPRCSKVRLNSNGADVELTNNLREHILKSVTDYGTKDSLRCLAMAVKENMQPVETYNLKDPSNFINIESDLTFVGVVGMLDPPRLEVAPAIAECREAGIRVIVVTGDNKATAEAICRSIGIFSHDEDTKGKSFTGREFDQLPEYEQRMVVRQASLFARVEPVHKQKLVTLLQEQHEVVAMTGDGVNDAPALSKADIGVAMGSGTAVAKGAADMVLADDNFSTIVNAVEEGRSIYNNTKQFIRFLISSNIGEVVSIFLAAALGMPEALSPVQLLWVNLVTDGLPATALGFNPPESDIMKRPPRSATEPIVNGWLFFRYIVVGTWVGLATVLGPIWWFLYYENGPLITFYELTHFHGCTNHTFANGYDCSVFTHDPRPSTVALTILVTIEMFNAFNSTCENQSIIKMPPWKNMWLIYAVATSFALHFMVLYIPVFSFMFGVAALTWAEWYAVLALSLPVIIIDEVCKFASRNIMMKKERASTKAD